jgi:hypothetical protein
VVGRLIVVRKEVSTKEELQQFQEA